MFKWIKGRQESGYSKLCLVYFWFFDAYLIKFKEGSSISPHVDEVSNKSHFRCNIIIKPAKEGGDFVCTRNILSLFNRIYIFRPDKERHEVTEVIKGNRIVFSFGIAI